MPPPAAPLPLQAAPPCWPPPAVGRGWRTGSTHGGESLNGIIRRSGKRRARYMDRPPAALGDDDRQRALLCDRIILGCQKYMAGARARPDDTEPTGERGQALSRGAPCCQGGERLCQRSRLPARCQQCSVPQWYCRSHWHPRWNWWCACSRRFKPNHKEPNTGSRSILRCRHCVLKLQHTCARVPPVALAVQSFGSANSKGTLVGQSTVSTFKQQCLLGACMLRG